VHRRHRREAVHLYGDERVDYGNVDGRRGAGLMAAATERLWFNSDRTALVHDGDADAAMLACAEGDEIPDGFTAPAVKQAAKAADKAIKAAENK
jgi:hypothetical protein